MQDAPGAERREQRKMLNARLAAAVTEHSDRDAAATEVIRQWWEQIREFTPDGMYSDLDVDGFCIQQLTHCHDIEFQSFYTSTFNECSCSFRDETNTVFAKDLCQYFTNYLHRERETFRGAYGETMRLMLLGKTDDGSGLSVVPCETLHRIILLVIRW